MVSFDPAFLTAFLVSLFAVAAATAVLTVTVLGRVLLASRGRRLARRESIPVYYGRLVTGH